MIFCIGSRRFKIRVTFRSCGIWSVYCYDLFPFAMGNQYLACKDAHDLQGLQVIVVCKDLDS